MTLRPYRTSILLAITFTVLLSTFWYLPQLAFIVFISLLLQLLLSPLVERLAAHLPRGVAASLSLLVLLLLEFWVGGIFQKLYTRCNKAQNAICNEPRYHDNGHQVRALQESDWKNHSKNEKHEAK